jgi:hypothetical protein
MNARLLALTLAAGAAAPLPAQTLPERAVRRDVPMTNAIRRAHAAGTRDSTGPPGAQLLAAARRLHHRGALDPATSRLTGRETVVVHNRSPDSLSVIGLRLDPNIFLGNTPQAATWVPGRGDRRDGDHAHARDGDSVSLARPALAAGRGAGDPDRAGGAGRAGARGADAARAPAPPTRASRCRPKLAPRATATLDIEWTHKLPGGPGVGHRMTQRWADTLYQPTQWYPRVAVYDDLRGWDAELYLGPSEFYNNFGAST